MLSNESMKKESRLEFKMYIDFDSKRQIFYHNFFFEEFKFVLKIALTAPLIYRKNNYNKHTEKITNGNNIFLKYERFDLTKYTFLLSYE